MLRDTVRPSSGPSGTPSSRKLRDSCNDCASSKVRCSKQKPTCARCARRGVTCTYLASRRTGRASSNASKTGQPQVWLNSTTPGLGAGGPGGLGRTLPNVAGPRSRVNPRPDALLSVSQHSPNLTTDVWLPALSPSALADDVTGLSLPPLTYLEDSGVDNSFEYRLRPSTLFDCLGKPNTVDPSLYPTISNLEVDRFLTDMISNSASDGFPPTTTNSRSNYASAYTKPDTCCTIILGILSRVLAQIPSTCTLSTASGTLHNPINGPELNTSTGLATEDMIDDSKQIIDSLISLLDCPCTQEGHLVSIMALVARKVLERYTARPTRRSQHAPPSSFASSCSPNSTATSSPSSTPTTTPSTTTPISLPLTVSPRDISSPPSHLYSSSSGSSAAINPAAPGPPPARGTIWPGSTPSSESSSPTGAVPDLRPLFGTTTSSAVVQTGSSWATHGQSDDTKTANHDNNGNGKPTEPSLLFQAAQLAVLPPSTSAEVQRAQELLDVLRARLERIRAWAGAGRAGAARTGAAGG